MAAKGRVFMGSNPVRARASGLRNGASQTDSMIGELFLVLLIEFAILAMLRLKFKSHHGG